ERADPDWLVLEGAGDDVMPPSRDASDATWRGAKACTVSIAITDTITTAAPSTSQRARFPCTNISHQGAASSISTDDVARRRPSGASTLRAASRGIRVLSAPSTAGSNDAAAPTAPGAINVGSTPGNAGICFEVSW